MTAEAVPGGKVLALRALAGCLRNASNHEEDMPKKWYLAVRFSSRPPHVQNDCGAAAHAAPRRAVLASGMSAPLHRSALWSC